MTSRSSVLGINLADVLGSESALRDVVKALDTLGTLCKSGWIQVRVGTNRKEHIYVLNLESGFNDGLALPIVLLLMSAVQRNESPGRIAVELVAGIALGVGIPLLP